MKVRNIGILILFFATIMGIVVFMYHQTVHNIINEVEIDENCPGNDLLDLHSDIHRNISYSFSGIIFLIGLYLIIFGNNNYIEIKKINSPNKIKVDYIEEISKTLTENEKKVFDVIIENKGSILQTQIEQKTNLSKVTLSRTLEKLENKKIITKQRYGMTNLIILEKRNTEEQDG